MINTKKHSLVDSFSSLTADVQSSGQYIVNTDIEFKGILRGKNYTINLGKAILQTISHETIPTTLFDYIKSCYDIPPKKQQLLLGVLIALNFVDQSITGKFSILHHFEIFEEFRGKNLSKVFLDLILQILRDQLKTNYVFLQAFPVGVDLRDVEYIKKEQTRLESLYSKAGFSFVENRTLRSVHNSEIEAHYMYMKL